MPEKNIELPTAYKWLRSEKNLVLLPEALKLFGVVESAGAANNPTILAWADEIGGWLGDFYNKDEIPWCGLFMGVVAKRAGYPFGQKALSAKAWDGWGVDAPKPGLDDVLIFSRTGGGHVGIYVGEDDECYHVYGGNQSDQVCFTRLAKDRLWSARRVPGSKAGRIVKLRPSGLISENEA